VFFFFLSRKFPFPMALSPFSLADRTAVVLGGTSGLGRTLALGLAAPAPMVVSARRQALVDATASKLKPRAARHSEFV